MHDCSFKVEISFRIFFCDWLGHWNKSFWLKHVVASFKCVGTFSNIQQHGEISISHFTFIVIFFYLVFSDAIHSFSVFINHLLCFCISVFRFSSKHLRMCVLNITVWQEVFEKFLPTKLFFVKFQTFSLQAFTFPSSLIPNTQSRHFLWSPIQKTLEFRKGDNNSRWSPYADLEAAIQNILLNRCS